MSGSTDLPYTIPEMKTTISRTTVTIQETSTKSYSFEEEDPFEQSTVGNSDTESTSPSTIVDVAEKETTVSVVTPTTPNTTPASSTGTINSSFIIQCPGM